MKMSAMNVLNGIAKNRKEITNTSGFLTCELMEHSHSVLVLLNIIHSEDNILDNNLN